MSLFRYDAKTDGNQKAIINGLEDCGATVERLAHAGGGCPDLLVGFGGDNYLLEVKMPGCHLNEKQINWHSRWNGKRVAVVTDLPSALRSLGAL